MSVVGPRPALPNEVATYNDYQRQRLLVKPGMTCYWQTRRNRDSITFDEWVDLDLWKGSAEAKHAIESRCCPTFGMDAHTRPTAVEGIGRSTGATATKRFDDASAPSEIALWMQSEFIGPWYAAYESGCTGFHLCRELRALDIDCDVIAVNQKSFDETLISFPSLNPVFDVKVSWVNAAGNRQAKITHISL